MEGIIELVKVFFISISPLEMKAGIPIAIVNYKINPITAYLVCSLANVLAFPVVLTFINTIHKPLLKNRKYKQVCVKFAKRSKAKTAHLITKYGMSGLFLFVLIPLPLTGAYAGSVVAWLLNANKKQAFVSIGCGVMMAGLLVTFFTLMAQRGTFHALNMHNVLGTAK